MIETSDVSSGLPETSGPMTGIAKPPTWLNKLFGGPLTRRIDRLIGSSVFQFANVFRVVIRLVPPGGRYRWLVWPGAVGMEFTVMVKLPSSLRTRSLPLMLSAVSPLRPVRTLKLVSAGSAPSNFPVITYEDALFTPTKR